MSDVIVVGGGAAGMMAAIAAAQSGCHVRLFEKNEKLGKKIFITGKGRCNVTNACDKEDFFDHIVTNPKFMFSAFGKWNNWDMYNFLEEQGLRLKIERGNRVFPESDHSSDVIKTLQSAMDREGVDWKLNTSVKKLLIEDLEVGKAAEELAASHETRKKTGRKAKGPAKICRGVVLGSGETVMADRVILATGGLSYPSTGSTGDGYRFAKSAGHTVTELLPALVPFDAVLKDGGSCKELQGLALKNISIRILQGEQTLVTDFGEMLFTHFGVSGPVLLTASNQVTSSIRSGELILFVDLKPALTEEQLDARLLRELELGANKQMNHLLGTLLPSKMIPVMLRYAGIDPAKRGREITREERLRLLYELKNFRIRLLRTRSFNEAIITQGGVSVKELQPSTMESRLVRNLFFAGEILDVDAYTGGYNLQVAWSTGYTAGKSASVE